MRDGLNAFSLAGPLGRFLDADQDVLLAGSFVTFELETLMAMGPKVVVPVATVQHITAAASNQGVVAVFTVQVVTAP